MTSIINQFAWIVPTVTLFAVVWLYFANNPLKHSKKYVWRRFINWFPLGMTYAFLYMGRYNLSVSKNALGDMMPNQDFGLIFGVGTTVYGLSFLLNGPLVDKFGGKKGMIVAALGSAICNAMMGVATYLFLNGRLKMNLTTVFIFLYAANMFFQSYGAVSIIKVKAYWFHVRERGIFGAIFGTLISMGAYFAFDWGQAIVTASQVKLEGPLTTFQKIFRAMFAIDTGTTNAYWLVFFIPAFILVIWGLIDVFLLKDTPAEANFADFDPHDASSDNPDEPDLSIKELLKKIFSHPVLLTVAVIEFCSGVLRNGIMQWYFVFAKEIPQTGAEFFLQNWGLCLFVFGVIGGFAGGWISDRLFHSRRGPPSAIFNGLMFLFAIGMAVFLFTSPILVGLLALLIIAAVIGVHSLMSGTAAADFGGRKATGTASGIVDGFVYLGSGIQSVSIGYLSKSYGWTVWPLFLIPFAFVAFIFSIRMWKALPASTQRYLESVENVKITVKKTTITVQETTFVATKSDS